MKSRSLDQRKHPSKIESSFQDSSINSDEQILRPRAAVNSDSFDEQFLNDDKNRERTTYIGKLSDKLSEIDSQKQ